MEKPSKVSHRAVDDMRSLGRSSTDKGMIEVDLANGEVRWANDFFLGKTGYALAELETKTVFDIVPSAFHAEIVERLQSPRPPKFSVCPVLARDGKVVWWFLTPIRQEHAIDWSQGDFVQVTEPEGQAYAFMRLMMTATNSYGELHGRIDGMDGWMRGEIARIDRHDKAQDDRIKMVEERATAAAQSAAKTAEEMHGSIKEFKAEFGEAMNVVRADQATHASEILKLIINDSDFKKRQDEMLAHIKATMTRATGEATQAITIQATREGKSLSRKVVVPSAVITTILTFIATVIQYFLNKP